MKKIIYDENGYEIKGCIIKLHDRERPIKQQHDEEGYDKEGFNREGYNREGYNREGYDRRGFNKDGYDKRGKIDYEILGIDKNHPFIKVLNSKNRIGELNCSGICCVGGEVGLLISLFLFKKGPNDRGEAYEIFKNNEDKINDKMFDYFLGGIKQENLKSIRLSELYYKISKISRIYKFKKYQSYNNNFSDNPLLKIFQKNKSSE